jgi:integrase
MSRGSAARHPMSSLRMGLRRHFIGVVRVLDRVCARAGLEYVTPHVLRHTFASIAARSGSANSRSRACSGMVRGG